MARFKGVWVSAILLAGYAPLAVAQPNDFYCANGPDHRGMYTLALKDRPDRNVAFGVSLWWPDGKNVAISGIAQPSTNGWRYEDPQDRCLVTIAPAGGGYSLAIDQARCEDRGGFQAVPARVVFTKAMRQGPAGNLLASTEVFWNVKCGAKPAGKSPPLEVGW